MGNDELRDKVKSIGLTKEQIELLLKALNKLEQALKEGK